MKKEFQLLFIGIFYLSVIVCQQTFVKTEYTEVISVLNDAIYSAIDESYGTTEVLRIQQRLIQIQNQYPQTIDVVKGLSVIEASERHAIFTNENQKQVFLAIRGTDTLKVNLEQDSQIWLNNMPVYSYEIAQIMSHNMTDFSKQGYDVIVCGHSVGATLALLTCSNNSWIKHCEIHNPYLDDSFFDKINPLLRATNMQKKIIIQETIGDYLSQRYPTKQMDAVYSFFEIQSVGQSIGNDTCITLFIKAHLYDRINYIFNSQELERLKKIDQIEQNLKSIADQFLEKFAWLFYSIRQCQYNQYFDLYYNACQSCPPNFGCASSFLGPYTCRIGSIPNQQTGICESCGQGKFADLGSLICQDCQLGSYCINGVKIECPPGTFNNDPKSQQCQKCSSRFYQNEKAQSICKQCPPGYQCPTSGMTYPIPCIPGTYNPRFKEDQCYSCDPGSFQIQSGQSSCDLCPEGYKCPAKDQSPIPCPPGYYNANKKQTQCYLCDLGSYQTNYGQSFCERCPAGNYCPKQDQEPIPCPPGTYNRNTKQDQCYQCDTGRYQTQSGMSFCNECPAGYQCPSRNLDPIPCPPNTYNANKNQDRCYPCSSSQYQPLSGQTSCIPIPKNFLNQKNQIY
ncbi:hypothetical protein ABPG74_020623 [Tetrahymena malaccensis]